jgi:hypothetical protein
LKCLYRVLVFSPRLQQEAGCGPLRIRATGRHFRGSRFYHARSHFCLYRAASLAGPAYTADLAPREIDALVAFLQSRKFERR